MGMLENIQTGKEQKPPRIMIYGSEGVGKSTFGASAPGAIFVQTEDGLGEINCKKFPLAHSVAEVLSELTALRDEPHDFQTVVIDSADWLERLIFDEVCREYGVRSIEKADGGYGRGYTHALTHWRKVIALLQELRDKRNMMVILVAHAKVERFEDPENAAYDRYTPRLHKHAASLIAEWVDAVLFANKKFRVTKENAGFTGERAIAAPIGADGGERIIRTVGSPACIAKNRYGLPAELPLSWRLSTPIRKSRVKTMSKCGAICEVFSRVCGYFRPVSNWNKGKQEEFKERKVYEVKKNARKNPDGVSSDGV